ncbi:MAG: LemA family protein [Paludibacteraceae bacterium]|nr:LemA family protein [Paludibacteraceae bacterium]MBO7635914.1 LemA family protein [Paludibacteraceae bacterium]MBR5971156.1 LemA family protein [Paludibacteraceae bacterium]
MSKTGIILIGVLAVIAIYLFSAYNSLVTKDEGVTAEWQNVEAAYQRRADLIPNLVETVKGYAKHESTTLKEVIEARANATSIKIDPSNVTPEQLAEYMKAQNGVSSALSRLIAVAESYPDLKANQNFLELQSQLEGTENRIAVARKNYNDVAKDFNSAIRRVPNNIIASFAGLEKHAYFEAEEGAEKAPKVQF